MVVVHLQSILPWINDCCGPGYVRQMDLCDRQFFKIQLSVSGRIFLWNSSMALVFLTRIASHGLLISSSLIGGHVVVSAATTVWLDCLGVGYLQHFGSQRVQVWFPFSVLMECRFRGTCNRLILLHSRQWVKLLTHECCN